MWLKSLNIIYRSVNRTDIVTDTHWDLSTEDDKLILKPSFPNTNKDEIMYIELLQNAQDILVTRVPMDCYCLYFSRWEITERILKVMHDLLIVSLWTTNFLPISQ